MNPNRDSNPSQVVAGSTLSVLITVYKAYANTDAPVMFGRMMRDARWPSRLALLCSPLALLGAVKWHSDFGIQAAAVLMFACIYWFKRDAFRQYYARKSTATFLDTFTNKAQAIRYIMFRENVPKSVINDDVLLERILRLLEQRQKVRRAGVVTRHPVVTALVALFLMILGSLVSQGVDASLPLTLTVMFLVGMLTLVAMQLGVVWRTHEYREEELTEFVLWLWAEASDDQAPHQDQSLTGA